MRNRDVYPGSRILIFTHPGSRIQKRQQKRGEKICCHTFFCSHKFHKIANYFIFLMMKKKIWPILKKFQNFLPKKLSQSPQKYGLGIRDPEKTYSGSRIPDLGQKGTGSRIRICNTAKNLLQHPTEIPVTYIKTYRSHKKDTTYSGCRNTKTYGSKF